jgi:hypothetical protein
MNNKRRPNRLKKIFDNQVDGLTQDKVSKLCALIRDCEKKINAAYGSCIEHRILFHSFFNQFMEVKNEALDEFHKEIGGFGDYDEYLEDSLAMSTAIPDRNELDKFFERIGY